MFYRRYVENLSLNTIFKPSSVSHQNSLPTPLTSGSKTRANISSNAIRELDSRIRPVRLRRNKATRRLHISEITDLTKHCITKWNVSK